MEARKVVGRKRFVLVDTEGRGLGVLVVPADWSEQHGARRRLAQLLPRLPRLLKIWADQGYKAMFVDWVAEHLAVAVDIVGKAPGQIGFAVEPRR